MKPPRGLSDAEQAMWAQIARTVTPLRGKIVHPLVHIGQAKRLAAPSGPDMANAPAPADPPQRLKGRVPPPLARQAAVLPVSTAPLGSAALDSQWEQRLRSGALMPDFTLDLHGATLDGAHRQLDLGLMQAKAMGARVVLVVTGRPRPVEAADRAHRRGAIRAKILDWLAAGPHATDIAAVRHAHRRHGGEGALYLVLRRRR